MKVFGDGLPVGPILVGLNKPAHVMTEAVTVRGIVNMCAVAAAEAIDLKHAGNNKQKTWNAYDSLPHLASRSR